MEDKSGEKYSKKKNHRDNRIHIRGSHVEKKILEIRRE